jgi:hypothetical protein
MNSSKASTFHYLSQLENSLVAKVEPNNSADSDGIISTGSNDIESPQETIRYANTADGMLCQRDPDVLLRYVYMAKSDEEKALRQNELFQRASVRLACLPNGSNFDYLEVSREQSSFDPRIQAGQGEDFLETGVVNTGLFCCPIVLTFIETKNVIRRLALDHPKQVHIRREIESALAMFSCTPLASVSVESIIAIDDLNGITPLQVQEALTREARKMSAQFEPDQVEVPQTMANPRHDLIRQHQANWSLNLPQRQEIAVPVGGTRPAAFLVVAFFSWDRNFDAPKFDGPWMSGHRRLQELLEGYLSQDICSEVGESGRNAGPERTLVEVGRPAFIQSALTRAQIMLYQNMTEDALARGDSFGLKVEQHASVLHWHATTVSNANQSSDFNLEPENASLAFPPYSCTDDDELLTVVEHVYDSTWRPQSHIDEIQRGALEVVEKTKSFETSMIDFTSEPVQLEFQFDRETRPWAALGKSSIQSDDEASELERSIDELDDPTLH